MTLMPYGSLLGAGSNGSDKYVEVIEQRFRKVLISLVQKIEFDEEWYRQRYGDIAEAIEQGRISSARQHYIKDGYFEDRLPRPVTVDEKWYRQKYPDVAQAIRDGAFRSAQEHFETSGFREGRLPYEGWIL